MPRTPKKGELYGEFSIKLIIFASLRPRGAPRDRAGPPTSPESSQTPGTSCSRPRQPASTLSATRCSPRCGRTTRRSSPPATWLTRQWHRAESADGPSEPRPTTSCCASMLIPMTCCDSPATSPFPSTNLSERDVRMVKIAQKVSGGFAALQAPRHSWPFGVTFPPPPSKASTGSTQSNASSSGIRGCQLPRAPVLEPPGSPGPLRQQGDLNSYDGALSRKTLYVRELRVLGDAIGGPSTMAHEAWQERTQM